jgi:hypothetical protein
MTYIEQRESEMTKIKQFRVQADSETGQWIEGTLEYVQMVDSAEWLSQPDTDERHYDTYEPTTPDIDTESETRAIEVCWVS